MSGYTDLASSTVHTSLASVQKSTLMEMVPHSSAVPKNKLKVQFSKMRTRPSSAVPPPTSADNPCNTQQGFQEGFNWVREGFDRVSRGSLPLRGLVLTHRGVQLLAEGVHGSPKGFQSGFKRVVELRGFMLLTVGCSCWWKGYTATKAT
jgi:hypothetical protein